MEKSKNGWLVLKLKPRDGFLIGDEIEVSVSAISPGDQVAIAIRAPKGLKILRKHLLRIEELREDRNPS